MTPARRLLGYFQRYRWSLTAGFVFVIGSSVFSLLKPLVVGHAVDALRGNFTRADLFRFAAMYVGASLVQGVFLYLQRWVIIGVSRKIEYDMRQDFYDHMQTLPLRFYHEQRTGDLMSRATNDLASVRMLIGPAVMHSVSSVLVVTGAFIMMLGINRPLALMALVSVPLVAGIVKTFGERVHVRFKAVQDYFGDISARVQENLAGVRVVRAFTQERNEIEQFKRMNHEYVEKNRALVRLTATFYPLLQSIIGFMFVLVFYVGTRKILSGDMSIGDFVAFQFYLGRMIWPLIALGWVINLFQRGMASMKRLSQVWDVTPEAASVGVCAVEEFRGGIEIKHLTFAYDKRPVLENINLRVEPGETVGIVGRTGSGKSTLLAVIARMFDPPPHTVFVDGCAVEAVPIRKLRDVIGMVPQETFLFSESIAENIRFGRAEASDEEIGSVAELAGLRGDISTFSNGIETVIGERGITLSGGQKQRTAIARALVRNPQILILDDALSAVDTATEERILRSLREIRKGRTVLIVSHRVSSVKDADKIIVLERGRIVEQGDHDELLALGGYYADLYRRQVLEEAIEEIA